MKRTHLSLKTLLIATLLSMAAQAHAQLQLISEAEAQASRAAPEPMTMKAVPVPGAPQINLLTPSLSGAVPSPTRIQLRFVPTAPAVIVPDSFKVRYGSFRLDITARLKGSAQVTAEGIDVSEATLPKGSHKLYIEIQDSVGRLGERLVQFAVE